MKNHFTPGAFEYDPDDWEDDFEDHSGETYAVPSKNEISSLKFFRVDHHVYQGSKQLKKSLGNYLQVKGNVVTDIREILRSIATGVVFYQYDQYAITTDLWFELEEDMTAFLLAYKGK